MDTMATVSARSIVDDFAMATERQLGLGKFADLLSESQKDALRRRRLNFPNAKPGQAGLSCCKYLSYCAPSFSTVPLTVLISAFVIAFYEKIGADLTSLAFFVALGGGLEVVMDPAMSYMTDSCRTSWGRRRPFLTLGCIPYAASFVLLLTPGGPGIGTLSPSAASAWFGAFYILFKCCNSFTNIPYDALAPEVTDHPQSRSKLFFFCTLFDGFGSLCACALPIGLQGTITAYRTPDYASCEAPDAAGSIDLDSCSNYHSEIRGAMNWTVALSPEARGWSSNSTFCVDVDNNDGTYGGSETLPGDPSYSDMQSYCSCRGFCLSANTLDNTRGSYFTVGLFFGAWYVISMAFCVINIKERCQAGADDASKVEALPKPSPIMPSSLKTFRNKPFTLLLPAWICDALVSALISSLLTYFVRYIVEPEYAEAHDSIGCLGGRNTGKWQCQSDMVLGVAILAVLVAAVVGSPIWLFLASPDRLGKRNTWLLWSLVMACTNPLYLFIGPGQVNAVILVSFINGLPFGAKFLADAILADVIDYDEFLTGTRAEATYTMFKSFLPKMAAIPAAAIPTALLTLFGHIAPIDGVYQKQTSAGLLIYIKMVVVIIPSCLSVVAFLFKIRFPLRTTEQNHLISAGIGQHIKARNWIAAQKKKEDNWGTVAYAPYEPIADWYNADGNEDKIREELKEKHKELPSKTIWEGGSRGTVLDEVIEAYWSDPRHYLPENLQPQDPISYVHYNLIEFSDDAPADADADGVSELDEMNRMDNFPGADVSQWFADDGVAAAARVHKKAVCQLVTVLLMLAGSGVGVALTGDMLFSSTEEHVVAGEAMPESAGEDNSWIPVLFIVVVGVSITMSIASCLRLAAAGDIVARPPSKKIMEKIHLQREQLELAEDIDTSLCAGMRRHPVGEDGLEHRAEQGAIVAKDAGYYLPNPSLPTAVDGDDDGLGGATASEDTTEKLRTAFHMYDMDGDGTITFDELKAAMESMNERGNSLQHTDEELREMMDLVDEDGDQEIDFNEFGEQRTHLT